MAIPFDRFARVADRAGDRIFGEDILIEPQLRSRAYTGAGSPDPDRPARTITGCFVAKPIEAPLSGEGAAEPGMGRLQLRVTSLRLSAEVVASLGYGLREGDRVTRLGRDTDNAFAVVAAVPTDLGELTIDLVNAQ